MSEMRMSKQEQLYCELKHCEQASRDRGLKAADTGINATTWCSQTLCSFSNSQCCHKAGEQVEGLALPVDYQREISALTVGT